ncbi:MAG: DUF1566 domain-containing protein [Vicinamibacterales bacterium]
MTDTKSFWTTMPGILTALGGVIAATTSLIGALYSAGLVGTPRDALEDPAVREAKADPADARPAKPAQASGPSLRTVPATLTGRQLDAMLVTRGFFDKARNPAGAGLAHEYEPRATGDAVVVLDHATRLMWQQGSPRPMRFAEAGEYVARLNAGRFAGFADWRLPTAEEAMSLMEPRAVENGPHLAAVFRRGVNFIWTGDRTEDGRGWVLYFYDGIAGAEPPDFNAWVRAVRPIG